jgi:hypothetical protein
MGRSMLGACSLAHMEQDGCDGIGWGTNADGARLYIEPLCIGALHKRQDTEQIPKVNRISLYVATP